MKRLSIIILIFFLSCSFNSGAAQPATIERGRDLLKQGSYKEAISVFEALLARAPNDAAPSLGLVRAMFETGDYASAEKRAKDYLSGQAADSAMRVSLGDIEFETGRYAEAAAEFERAARDSKNTVWLGAMLGRARALLAQGKEDEARAVL